MKAVFAILCATLLAGCSNVEMKEPFPVSPLSEDERAQLEGLWREDDDVVQVAFASNGIAYLANVEWNKEDEEFRLETIPLHFAKREKKLYVSFRTEDKDGGSEPSGYVFLEVKPSNRNAILWPANAEFFEGLVRSGKLKGSIEEGKHATTVRLDTPAADILGLVATNAAAFNYKEPTVLQRLR